MKHLFVPYSIAVIAKEKGFNEPCIAHYYQRTNPLSIIDKSMQLYLMSEDKDQWDEYREAAPLYCQLVDWFREKHDLCIMIVGGRKEGIENYDFCLSDATTGMVKYGVISTSLASDGSKSYYNTFTKAIEEAFKLI